MKAKEMKILLVEDEPSVRKGVKEWLTDDGYSIESVETGEQALERVKKEPYGVIVLDLRLPDIDGLQEFRSKLAHNDQPIRHGRYFFQYPALIIVRIAQDCVQCGNNGHAQFAQ